MTKTVYYASVGPALTLYDVDVENAALTARDTVTLPADVQYAWPHPSRRMLYVVSSNGGPGVIGDKHFASALAIDPATGALRQPGEPALLPSRPIHVSVDASGVYLLTAYNAPSGMTVHRINADGTLGAAVAQRDDLDTGIYAHQVLAAPGNRVAMLVTRGNNPGGGKPEDPGAIKTFRFNDGAAEQLGLGRARSTVPARALASGRGISTSIRPSLGSSSRSSDRTSFTFTSATPRARWRPRRCLSRRRCPIPSRAVPQGAGPVHVHPNGRFVYLTNRTFPASGPGARQLAPGGENSIAVFAIDAATGEPALIQNIDGHGIQLRTFGIDPAGRMLVAASTMALADGTLPAGLSVFRIAADGRLSFVRKYDVEVGNRQQFWSGMVTLPPP